MPLNNTTELEIFDDGEGIFKKLQRELGLHDERHAVLELAKGKSIIYANTFTHL